MATQRRLALISVIEQLAEPDCCTVETYQEIIQRNPEFKQARANNLEFSKQLRNGRKKTIHDTHVKLNTHAQRRYTRRRGGFSDGSHTVDSRVGSAHAEVNSTVSDLNVLCSIALC